MKRTSETQSKSRRRVPVRAGANASKSSPGRVLAFGAHPDDVEFGCGGVLVLEARAGRPVHLVICSRGESATNGTPDQREREARAAAQRLGASLEFISLGGDAHFEITLQRVLQLAEILRRHRPQVVLAPTLVENQHPDHARLGRMVRDAARLARYGGVAELREHPAHAIGALLHYAITPEAEPAGETPVLVDISGVVREWTAAMQAHSSQLATRNYVDLQLTRARLHGLRAGVEHAMPLFPADPLVVQGLAGLERSARRF